MYWRPEFILLLAATTPIDFFAAQWIRKGKVSLRKPILAASVLLNLTILFFFKYLGFFTDTVQWIFDILNIGIVIPQYSIILPLGISFYTFQGLGYTVDVYRGKIEPERNFLKMFLFLAFFPQLVAGPIERAGDLMHQLYSNKKHLSIDIPGAVGYLTLGFFKKAVVADRLAPIVNTVYAMPEAYAGLPSIIATLFFAFQIYCDFSGYSDIAIGSAKLLGVDLTRNFRQPYLSGSIREFWRRWHISLSFWIRDYIYIPLGGSRVSKPRYYLNIMLTFLASGLWHGANWTFVIWGGLHGVFQMAESLFSPKRRKKTIFHIILTFLLVNLAWIFFRAENMRDAVFIVSNLTYGFRNWSDVQYIFETLSGMGGLLLDVLINIGLILVVAVLDLIAGEEDLVEKTQKLSADFALVLMAVLFVLIMMFGVFHTSGEFIYFQF
jgi:D-alanyl-lipoteichoic acid acyltransferase DltB (MBOAT superfamily)